MGGHLTLTAAGRQRVIEILEAADRLGLHWWKVTTDNNGYVGGYRVEVSDHPLD